MDGSTMSDFAVGSNGHCFFCLSQIMNVKPPQNPSLVITPQSNSIQYLTRYLKMDLRKVFIDKGQVSPELLAKVEKARLKVELCEECRCLSEKFSKVYRQLEKLQLELGSTLGLIHGKLASTDATDNLRGLSVGLNSNWNGLLEVLNVLRAEAIQKSSYKLSDTPRVKIQHLTKKEVKAKQDILANDEGSSQTAKDAEVVSHRGLETSGVRMESPIGDSLSDNDDGNYSSEDVNSNLQSKTLNDYAEIGTGRNADGDSVHRNMMTIGNKKVVSRPTGHIVETRKFSIIDPETGKWKCKNCYKEFNSAAGFRLHYQTVHLKLRYKCVSCGKLFSQLGSLTFHQRTSQRCSTTESAPKFKCHLCKKIFAHKQVLGRHLDGVHYKLRKHACDLCELKFNTKNQLGVHKRKLHGMGKSNDK